LNQSDIFSHFGVGKGKSSSSSGAKEQQPSGDSRGRGRRAATEEMDEDEKALAGEEGGDQVESTILLKQPSCISGGAMR